MSQTPSPARDRATVAQLPEFDDIIDARTPSEFALDHIPGACNLPVLSDSRARARRHAVQAGLAVQRPRSSAPPWWRPTSRAISKRSLLDRPKSWRPLVYCWRGGKRSGAFTHVLREIGWDARALEGGYKAFRRAVMSELAGAGAALALARAVRSHRLRQEPAAGHAGAPRRTGPRPRAARRPPRLGAGQPAGRAAADPEDVREPAVGPPAPLRSGASRVRRIGEQEDRRAAGAPGTARRDVGQPVRAAGRRPRDPRAAADGPVRALPGRSRRAGPAARLPGAAARPCDDRALEADGPRRRLGSAGGRAAGASLRSGVHARDRVALSAGCRRRGGSRSRRRTSSPSCRPRASCWRTAWRRWREPAQLLPGPARRAAQRRRPAAAEGRHQQHRPVRVQRRQRAAGRRARSRPSRTSWAG